jgi:hypothetical protein
MTVLILPTFCLGAGATESSERESESDSYMSSESLTMDLTFGFTPSGDGTATLAGAAVVRRTEGGFAVGESIANMKVSVR